MSQPPVVVIYSSDRVPENTSTFKQFAKRIAHGAWEDFKTTNRSTAGKGVKFGAGVLAASTAARMTGTLTPLRWLFSRFGPLPLEFTSSGVIQVFELTFAERLWAMARVAGAKFVLVTIAYEGGVLIGSVANQFLSEKTQDAIGGTINEIINEGGWKELWKHPFGIGL
jgi:hypothetical protein